MQCGGQCAAWIASYVARAPDAHPVHSAKRCDHTIMPLDCSMMVAHIIMKGSTRDRTALSRLKSYSAVCRMYYYKFNQIVSAMLQAK